MKTLSLVASCLFFASVNVFALQVGVQENKDIKQWIHRDLSPISQELEKKRKEIGTFLGYNIAQTKFDGKWTVSNIR